MIHLKVTSIILSTVMSMLMIMPSVSVIADEVSTPSETQKTEETEKPAPKATEKPASKDDKKETTKTTKNNEPAVTEGSEDKEAAKQEPTETQPAETENKESIHQETKEHEETTERKPEETEKRIPDQTEKQESAETEKQTPNESEPQETEKIPEETAIPIEKGPVSSDRRKAANIYYGTCGANINWTLDSNGTLSLIGSGAMYDYDLGEGINPPWNDYRDSIRKIVISEGITTIGDDAFSFEDDWVENDGGYNVTSVSLPDGLKSIGRLAFEGCAGLTSISIPQSVNRIGEGAFEGCISLSSITIPSGVTKIEDVVFQSCESLKSIVVPSGVTSIGQAAFADCKKLKSITIPASVKSISDSVFAGCDSLTDIYYKGSESDWNKISIDPENYEDLENVNMHFEGTSYALALGNITNGSATLSSYLANAGDIITVTVLPNTGYTLDVIKLNGTAISGKQFTMPASDVIVDVLFKKINYSVNLTVGEGGTASLSKTSANYGDEITVTTSPSTGCVLDTIKVNGTTISGNKFTMPAKNTTVEVSFKKVTYIISLNSVSNGTASLSKTSANYGDEITVTTSPSTGYVLDTIKVNGTTISGNKFTMPAKNTTVEVTFKKVTYTISLNSVSNGTASLSKTTAAEGEVITVTVNPDAGYTLDSIKVNGAVISGNSFTMSAQNTIVEVTFKKADYIITLSDIDPITGSASLSRNEACAGDEVVITVNPAKGYELDTISVNGKTISGLSFTMPEQNVTVIVTFKKTEIAISGKCGDNLTWVLDGNTLNISGSGEMTNWTTLLEVPWKNYSENISSVVFSGDVSSLGNYAFINCESLKNITIPKSITSIGKDTFYNCSSLTSIEIPSSVTSIGDGAFGCCKGLTSITIPNSVTFIGSSAFRHCSNLVSITVSNRVTSIGDMTFSDCSKLTSITIPNGVTSIGNGAFYDCSGLTSITIPSSVTSIGDCAFFSCIGLTSITIPDSVTSIGDSAFWDCSKLTSITIPNGVTSIDDYTFHNCSSLISIEIPSSVTSIGVCAFRSCKSLISITIPNSVTSIGDFAFCDCSGLKEVYYSGSIDEWNKITLNSSNDALINATIHFVKENTLSVKGKTAKVKYKKLRKKKQTVSRAKMMTVSGGQGKLTYKILSVNKKKTSFKINASTGAVTVKKKLKKGTYTLKVSVTAAGNDEYKPATKTVTFKIKVK